MHSLLIPYANWVHSPINSMHVNMFYHRISVLNSVQIFLTYLYLSMKKTSHKTDAEKNFSEEEDLGKRLPFRGLIMLGRIQPRKTVKTCKKTILANAENTIYTTKKIPYHLLEKVLSCVFSISSKK